MPNPADWVAAWAIAASIGVACGWFDDEEAGVAPPLNRSLRPEQAYGLLAPKGRGSDRPRSAEEPAVDRKAQITDIVNEAMDAQYAEQGRHGTAPDAYADCRCGWTPPERSRKPRVSLGVHIHAARRKAERTAKAEISERMAATRRPA